MNQREGSRVKEKVGGTHTWITRKPINIILIPPLKQLYNLKKYKVSALQAGTCSLIASTAQSTSIPNTTIWNMRYSLKIARKITLKNLLTNLPFPIKYILPTEKVHQLRNKPNLRGVKLTMGYLMMKNLGKIILPKLLTKRFFKQVSTIVLRLKKQTSRLFRTKLRRKDLEKGL